MPLQKCLLQVVAFPCGTTYLPTYLLDTDGMPLPQRQQQQFMNQPNSAFINTYVTQVFSEVLPDDMPTEYETALGAGSQRQWNIDNYAGNHVNR